MASFPGSLASFIGFTASHTLSADGHAAQHNLEQAEILAAQTKIGTGASTPTSNKVLRGTGVGTSAWGQVDQTTDITGATPIANGGTGQGNLSALPLVAPVITGGGSWTGSPTIVTPTIASMTNAQHNHQNAAGGGILSYAALLSTIFSGQLTSYANPGSAGGTFYYGNIGGIKLFFGETGSIAVAGSTFQSTTCIITFPVGFFTTIQTAIPICSAMVNTQFMHSGWVTDPDATSGNLYVIQNNGTNGAAKMYVLVIGT